ncbi:iron chelate uptake ABC transporter family permease subunit [Paracoccus wurundjeri]|uniref:iron chelate uptake ABC transporter family permease subunit n=1 Tax=Paracoccus onubensis TaxID=1675788 RepID=UPI00272EF461|nr:iron chelate uptake ABC transporter family permease subunit [Paracoccus onubensis]
MQGRPVDKRLRLIFAGLGLVLMVAIAVWMLQGLPEGRARSFVLGLRAERLAGLLLVGVTTGVATVMFQTLAGNRVLTPQIMGFDSLYILLQTILVAGLGITGFASIPTWSKFLLDTAVMIALGCILFGSLLGRGSRDIARTILTGVILGVMFRSLSAFIGRVLDPNEFAVVQQSSFASFGHLDAALLPVAAILTAAAVGLALSMAGQLDVLGLGRDRAVALGLRHRRVVFVTLGLVAVLVAVPTALIGPVTFFGLIVAGLTHGILRNPRHALLLPAAGMIAAIMLIAGQLVFERLLGQASFLSVVIEFAGGLFFLYLLLKGRIR